MHLDEFCDDWKDLGLNDEHDLWEMELAIMANPKGGKPNKDTGGLRKMRFAPSRWNTGKRGATRICYVYFEDHWMVLLVVAYGKSDKADLTPVEKQGIRAYIEDIQKWLTGRNY